MINYLDEVPEGYIKETQVTPSGKKTLRIIAPDGKKFRSIKSAQIYEKDIRKIAEGATIMSTQEHAETNKGANNTEYPGSEEDQSNHEDDSGSDDEQENNEDAKNNETVTDTDDGLPPPYQDPKENIKSPVKSKAAVTPRRVQDLPEGYTMERTPSTSNPKRKYIRITGPRGKTFTSIRAAIEYYQQNKNKVDNTEIFSEKESSDKNSKKDPKLSQTKKSTDKNDEADKKVSAEIKPSAKTATPAANKATVAKSKRNFLI